ncbi:MAG TPA: EamA family transporter RarD [Actinomycetes bacterium]|nr:EamA family transporter RarD [Actinomycetes bacterium]
MSERQRGLAYGLGAYLLWGVFPLYFPLLEPTSPVEILANRIVWSFVVLALVVVVGRRWAWIRPLSRDRRRLLLLAAAGLTLSLNWGVYIYGVNSEQVVQTSLGYFINPLVSVLFGVVLLRERLRRAQWYAVALGAVAVLVLSVDYGGLPWIALVLAFSFGTYGLLKKVLDMGALESLTVETALLTPIAGGYLLILVATGQSALASGDVSLSLLLLSTGVVTAIPLLLFGAAATRIPLTWIGLLQYVAPVLQFLIGVVVYGEPMPTSRWIGFTLVWVALVVLAADSLVAVRRGRGVPEHELEESAPEAH